MVELTVDLEIEKAYAELRALLLEKGCKIDAEEAPTLISVRQGSLWGISPLTAKKVVNCRLASVDSGTRITCSSSLASDWKKLTLFGSVVAVVFASLCIWIFMDLDMHLTTQQQSCWSWIATVNGYIATQTVQMFTDLLRMLTVFLAITLAAEMVIVAYVHFRINAFAERTLSALRKKSSRSFL